MSYKAEVIKRFEKTVSDELGKVAEAFLKEGEKSGGYTDFETEKDKLIKEHGIHENSFEEKGVIVSAKAFNSLKTDNKGSLWIHKVMDNLESLIATKKKEAQKKNEEFDIENIDLDELIEEAIKESEPKSMSANDYLSFRHDDVFKSENEDLIKDVDELATGLFLIKSSKKFINKLKAESFEELRVYRSISVPNVDTYLEKFLNKNIKQDIPMGTSWSRSPAKALSYHGGLNSQNHIKFHGNINPDGINYVMTLVKNMSFSFSQEKEFFLMTDAEVLIDKVEICDEQNLPISSIEVNPPISKKI